MRKLFIVVLISLAASVSMASYSMNDSMDLDNSVAKQREFKQLYELLLAVQLLESQIKFNNQKIGIMEQGDISPIFVEPLNAEIRQKRLETRLLHQRLGALRIILNSYLPNK